MNRDTYRHVCWPCESSFTVPTEALAPCPFCGAPCAKGVDDDLRRVVLGYGGADTNPIGTRTL